jgi:hypothetical protein
VRAAFAVVGAAVLAVLPASGASAADEVVLSSDGVSWGPTMNGPLFGTVVGLVPEESRTATLWVRNSSQHEVVLRLTLDSTTWSDSDYAAAMTAGAAAPGAVGSTVSITTAGPCRLILTGATLDPGETLPVTMTIALGDLTGRSGQDATVAMALGVTVFETSAATSATDCAAPTLVVPLTPPLQGSAAVAAQQPDSRSDAISIPGLALPFLLANTIASFNESPLLWAFLAVILGGSLFYILEYLPFRRRRRGEIDTTTAREDTTT